MDILAGLNAVTLIFVALCVFAIGYRFYGVFMANKVLKLDNERPVLCIIIMVLMIIVFIVTFKRSYELLNIKKDVIDKWGEKVRALITDEDLTVEEANAARAGLACEMLKT